MLCIKATFRALLSLISLGIRTLASAANPLEAVAIAADTRVGLREFVTSHAMGLAPIDCNHRLAAPLIFQFRNRLKVIGAYARAISAKVIEVEACGDRSDVKFVREAMGGPTFPLIAHRAIAALLLRPDPVPAAGSLFNLAPKCLFQRVRLYRLQMQPQPHRVVAALTAEPRHAAGAVVSQRETRATFVARKDYRSGVMSLVAACRFARASETIAIEDGGCIANPPGLGGLPYTNGDHIQELERRAKATLDKVLQPPVRGRGAFQRARLKMLLQPLSWMVRFADIANYAVVRIHKCIDVCDGGEWWHGRITPNKCFGLGRDVASTTSRPFPLFYRETPVNSGVLAYTSTILEQL